VVSESGITTRSEVEKLMEWKVNAALVGEALITANDVLTKMRELMS
jgi:indole-3-glycerol phosphate synthase